MINEKEIENLASLARIELNNDEKIKIAKDLNSVLDYVSELKNVATENEVNNSRKLSDQPINILREDSAPHDPGIYSRDILNEAPRTKNNFIAVKRILGNIK